MIPLSIPDLGGNEAAYLSRCVADNWVSSAGPFVTEMEQRMAMLCGRAYAVATVNGTAALHLALVTAGIGPGDTVAIPDWTFAATANAVFHAGARPVLVDISPDRWTMDPGALENALAATPIAAVVPVHALGMPADMVALGALSARHGVPLIEDAAGAIGAWAGDRPAGGLGDHAIFSFNGNKTVTAGGGGMIVTDDAAFATRARHLSTQARAGADYVHDAVGFNYRMTNINAAVGVAQLERLDAMLDAKRAIAARYDVALANRDDLEKMPKVAGTRPTYWLYAVRVARASDTAGLVSHLARAGVEARGFWHALSLQAPYAECARHLTGTSHALSGSVVVLPSSSNLSTADQDRVIAALNRWRAA